MARLLERLKSALLENSEPWQKCHAVREIDKARAVGGGANRIDEIDKGGASLGSSPITIKLNLSHAKMKRWRLVQSEKYNSRGMT